jgi:uncharacterized protein
MTDRQIPLRAVLTAAECPVCARDVVAAYRPFCSKRCADIDLGRWLKENYRIPTEEAPFEDEPDGRAAAGNGSTGQER